MVKFDLNKDAAKVKFMLEKKGLPKIVAEVVASVDLSGSTQDLYTRGVMQEAIQRFLPIALNFDDNGEVPVYGFNDGSNIAELAPLTSKNYQEYVRREILGNSSIPKWGGTDYSPVIWEALQDLGFHRLVPASPKPQGFWKKLLGGEDNEGGIWQLCKESKSKLPALYYHLTDGECSRPDEAKTRAVIEQCVAVKVPMYFNFIGIGRGNFQFIEALGEDYPNVGFTNIHDLETAATDEAFYELLLPGELIQRLKDYIR